VSFALRALKNDIKKMELQLKNAKGEEEKTIVCPGFYLKENMKTVDAGQQQMTNAMGAGQEK
jgi:ferredoxin-thioredoxin reductase catalytic subunit